MKLSSSSSNEPGFQTIRTIAFDDLPAEMRCAAFGVEYAHVRPPEGGDLFVTQYGWPFVRQLLPGNWYVDEWYSKRGEKLSGATGTVYRVPTREEDGPSIDLVVKFSRVGQEVLLAVATSWPDTVSPEEIAHACFNSPFEEFGLVTELRQGIYGPRNIRLMAQRPLAIYAPEERLELWQLGRIQARFSTHQRLLAKDQTTVDKAIELDIKRQYIMLYGWIKGIDAEQAFEYGDISKSELRELTRRVVGELRIKGFRVLDNKPKHFIVRRDARGRKLLHRRKQLVYGLVDFELLQRTKKYQRQFKYIQRSRYWQMQDHRLDTRPPGILPPHLKHARIFGVNYIFGTPPSGGRLWVVGTEAGLFDYFLPARWRRTPRLKLSSVNEIYRTRTRDGICVVYRRSRVGEWPQPASSIPGSDRITDCGYNSPFQEVAIAEELRKAGVSVIYPRAVYRTDHTSTKAGYIFDNRRYLTHVGLVMPEHDNEPLLVPDYDYYTIWGDFRGLDPQAHRRKHGDLSFVDLETACETELLDEKEFKHIGRTIRDRLTAIGIQVQGFMDHDFLLRVDDNGTLHRDKKGALDVTLSIDALSARRCHLIDEQSYSRIIFRTQTQLEKLGYEALNLAGHHLLLSINPDGQYQINKEGEVDVALCNFELIRLIHDPEP